MAKMTRDSEQRLAAIVDFASKPREFSYLVDVQPSRNRGISLNITLRNPTDANMLRLKKVAIISLHRALGTKRSAELPVGRARFPQQQLSTRNTHLTIEISAKYATRFKEMWHRRHGRLEDEENGSMGPDAFAPFVVRGAQEMKGAFPRRFK